MAQNAKKLAQALGAEIVSKVPDVGGGAFGAARLGRIIAVLKTQLRPARGRRLGRPTNPRWVRHPKVPMSEETTDKLHELARRASSVGRRVSPMQVAAQLLEEALAGTSRRPRARRQRARARS
jgi:hypothetical protein